MIKEIFDIEPVQKNSLIIFLGILPITFLQLYLFKPELIDKGVFVVIGSCLALTVCWYIINILPLTLFLEAIVDNDVNLVRYDTIIFLLGLLAIAWIILFTYIAYEFNLTFKNFIRCSIGMSFLRCIFWIVYSLIPNQKKT
ncbi:hypothetical protein [Mariniflexile sp. AS56]|uniref:hypothetical protein n=1 Tax=Mariniflexile sp. AS56 TaxID=3063957 RepID=UPI0026EDC221|nr:hypothetical protein [Mariniflexile sp. AS56]MDO7174248.1 hypothetical protein [Mariniflexile sp. AS56]